MFVFYAFFLVLLHSSQCASKNGTIFFAEDTLEKSHGKIIFTSLLFRHGDRAVTKTYPNDPYPLSVWKDGVGELTKIGKENAYQLGKWFKERYQDTILVDGYKSDKLVMQSSDVNRTIMSGQLVLAGAYPPSKDEMWASDGLGWQPIPIHVVSRAVDNLFSSMNLPCERVDFEYDLLSSNLELQKFYLKHEDVIDYVRQKSGNELPSDNFFELFEELWDLYDILQIQEMNNFTLPSWTRVVYPEPLKTLSTKRFEVDAYTSQLKRLASGPMLASFVNDMKNKRDGTFAPNIHFYSAHDTTLAPFLLLLGLYNDIAPPYCSSVIVELRQKDDDYVVTIMYRNSSDFPPYLLKVPGCDDVCTLDKFIEVTKPLIPDDWQAECEVTLFTRLQYLNPFDVIVILFVIALVGIIILVLLRICIEKRRRPYVSF